MSEVFTYTENVHYLGTCYLHLDAIAYVWTRNDREALIYLIGRNDPIELSGDDASRFLGLYKGIPAIPPETQKSRHPEG